MKLFLNIASIEATRATSHNPAKKTPQRICVVCGESFKSRRGNAKTCGPYCGATLTRINERTRKTKKQVPA